MSGFIVKKSRKQKKQKPHVSRDVNSYDLQREEQILRICRFLSPSLANIKYADIKEMCKCFELRNMDFIDDEQLTQSMDAWIQNRQKVRVLALKQHITNYQYNEKYVKRQNDSNYLIQSIEQVETIGGCDLRRLSSVYCCDTVILQHQLLDSSAAHKYRVFEVQYTSGDPDVTFHDHSYQFFLVQKHSQTKIHVSVGDWMPGIYWFRVRPVVRFEPTPRFGTFSPMICVVINWIGYVVRHWLQQHRELEHSIPLDLYRLVMKYANNVCPFKAALLRRIKARERKNAMQRVYHEHDAMSYTVNWTQIRRQQKRMKYRIGGGRRKLRRSIRKHNRHFA